MGQEGRVAIGGVVRWQDLGEHMPFDEAQLVEAADRLRRGREIQAVYVGGSRVEGYGNRRSDVDAYALVTAGELVDEKTGFDVEIINGQHIQFDYLPIPFVEGAISELKAQPPWAANLSRLGLRQLHRLVNSYPVYGHELIAGYKSQLEEHGLRWVCADRKIRDCENSLQDAYGAVESGHWDTAIYTTRAAVQWSVEAVLQLRGETGNEKWIFPRLTRSLGDEHPVTREFRELFASAPLGSGAQGALPYFNRSMQLVQTCLNTYTAAWRGRCSIGGKEAGLTKLAQHGLDHGLDGNLLPRSVHAFAMQNGDKVLLWRQARAHQVLTDRALAVWLALCSHASEDEAAKQLMATCDSMFAGIDDAQALVLKLARAWRDSGVLG